MGTIVTYTMNKDGEADVTIEALYKDLDSVAAATYNKNTKSFDGVVTAGDCVLFASTDAAANGVPQRIKAYNNRDLGTVNAAATKMIKFMGIKEHIRAMISTMEISSSLLM